MHVHSGEDASLLLSLTRRYTEPHRRYHDIRHVAQMLAWGRELALDDAQVWGVWFHDAVYDPRSDHNEEDSAALAERSLRRCGVADDVVRTVARIVLDTKTHTPTIAASAAVLDLDLGSLALPWEAFRANSAAIRLEYSHVEDEAFHAGRRAALGRLLDRPRLFSTSWGRAREAAARANLTRLLAEPAP